MSDSIIIGGYYYLRVIRYLQEHAASKEYGGAICKRKASGDVCKASVKMKVHSKVSNKRPLKARQKQSLLDNYRPMNHAARDVFSLSLCHRPMSRFFNRTDIDLTNKVEEVL